MADKTELLERIMAFDFDGDAPVALRFADRLANENKWSAAYAARVIVEYKRFVFLAVSGAGPVCPSEDVDEAWHLHLTYTRSYWQRFCKDTLGTELHHDPTRGGPSERAKHVRMYQHTLEAYTVAFGEAPPPDIWRPVEKRFPKARASVFDLTALHNRIAIGIAAVVAAIAAATFSYGATNPFALVGIRFLGVLVPALLTASAVGYVIYLRFRSAPAEPGDEHVRLDWADAAYLAGGAERLTTAALARLVEAGAVRVDRAGSRIEATGFQPDQLSLVEQVVLRMLPITCEKGKNDTGGEAFRAAHATVEAAFAGREKELIAQELLIDPVWEKRIKLLALLPLWLVLGFFALPRLIGGISNGHAVGFLVFTMIAGLIVGSIIVASSGRSFARRTRRGQAALDGMRAREQHLRESGNLEWSPPESEIAGPWAKLSADWSLVPRKPPYAFGTASVAGLAVALFGTEVLAGASAMALNDLKDFLPRQTTADAGAFGGGGCGSGCGGGGGGGGGGGCGGCGG